MRRALLSVALLVAVAAAAWLWWRAGTPDPAAIAPASPVAGMDTAAATTTTAPAGTGARGPADLDAGLPLEDLPATPWAHVDLDAIREVMPDNLFWKMAMPTRDEAVIAERAKERERWNVEYGKVLSGNATAEEVDAYYAERQRLSQDYVEFATYLLAEYGDVLTVRDVGLLKVAIELNLARLEELPRRIVEAHERREQQDAARRAWREHERAFGEAPIR